MKFLISVNLFSFACSSLAQNFCTRVDPPSECEQGVPGTKQVEATTFTKRCGSTKGTAVRELLDLSSSLAKRSNDSIAKTDATTIISTYFHVITRPTENSNRLVPSSTLDQQIRLLNTAYTRAGFQFRLDGVNRRSNNDWINGTDDSPDKMGAKVLRNGTYDTLNIYILSNFFTSSDLYGVCTFPNPAVRNRFVPVDPRVIQLDGCEIDIISLPGSSHPEANLGFTAAHETGHWLGLFHVFFDTDTFQPNRVCIDNDFVDDTPVQRCPTFNCPAVKKTCSLTVGNDSIHNIMDYSDDCCLDQTNGFTTGQINRMNYMYDATRAGL